MYLRNKTVTLVLFGLTFLIFIAFFAVQKISFSSGKPIKDQLNDIIEYAQIEKWNEAEESVDSLIKTWDKAKFLLSINYAEADYSMFLDNLSRIKGAVETKDETETISLAYSTIILWNNFIRIVPEP